MRSTLRHEEGSSNTSTRTPAFIGGRRVSRWEGALAAIIVGVIWLSLLAVGQTHASPLPASPTGVTTETPTSTSTPAASTTATPTPAASPTASAVDTPTLTSSPAASATATPMLTISPAATATFTPAATSPASPTTTPAPAIAFTRALSGLGVSAHAVSPSATVEMLIGIAAPVALTSAVLSDVIPRAWTVTDARGGKVTAVDADTQKVEWLLGDIAAGAVVTRTYSMTAPAPALPQSTFAFYTTLSTSGQLLTSERWSIGIIQPPAVELTQPQYPGIDVSTAVGARSSARAPVALAGSLSPHGPYSAQTDVCATCHRSHTGQSRNLASSAPSQSNLCLACHDGTGSSKVVKSQYTDPNVPPDNSTTSSFYAHRATNVSSHTNAMKDEFLNVQNRHAECGDCHDPHSAAATFAAGNAGGYTPSGALAGISGVTTSNTWTSAITFEYQLCYKCHSGYTTLLSYAKESYKVSDKAAELDPTRASFHPIEAAGTNATAKMQASLSGTSPYKLWSFTTGSVIRCVNCHGDYRLATPAAPPLATARLAPHTSRYRGLLMNNLRDRVLKTASDSYNAADFALCYQCHAEAPFVDEAKTSRGDTNFPLHGYHVHKPLGGGLASTDIDTAGAGQGRAICSECHYRIHGQGTEARGNPSGTRLVSFAPNVTNSGTQLRWDPTGRSCTLTCHGKDHDGLTYPP